jgi:hypothetical protein
VQQLEKQLKLTIGSESSWAFQYFDDEGDMIFVSTIKSVNLSNLKL